MSTHSGSAAAPAHEIDIQGEPDVPDFPATSLLRTWIESCLPESATEVCLQLVSEPGMRALNMQYRDKDKSTNVLSFPGAGDVGSGLLLLGDVVVCPEVVQREATEQKKTLHAHVAHMVVHGILHLQGFDHIDDSEALEMESREIELLATLGFPNPYETGEVAR